MSGPCGPFSLHPLVGRWPEWRRAWRVASAACGAVGRGSDPPSARERVTRHHAWQSRTGGAGVHRRDGCGCRRRALHPCPQEQGAYAAGAVVRSALKGTDGATAKEAELVTSQEGARLGLLWESDVVEHGRQRYAVRVVQKGTRLKSPGASLFSSAPVEVGAVVIVLLLPLRALSLLLFGQRYKVGVVRFGAYDAEDVLYKERVRGEATARARGREVLNDLARLVAS